MKPVTLAQAIPAPAPPAQGAGSAGADGFAELIQSLLTGPANGTAPGAGDGPAPDAKKKDAPDASADPSIPVVPAQFAAFTQMPAAPAPQPAVPAPDAPEATDPIPALPRQGVPTLAPTDAAALPAGPAPAPAPVSAEPGPKPASEAAKAQTLPVPGVPAAAQPAAPGAGTPAGTSAASLAYAAAANAVASPAVLQRGSGPAPGEVRAEPSQDADRPTAAAPVAAAAFVPAVPVAAPVDPVPAPVPVLSVPLQVTAVQERPVLRAPEPAAGQVSAPAGDAPQNASIQASQAAPAPAVPAAAAAAAPTTPAAPAPVRVPADYTAQLARPLVTIAAAGRGEHTMTVKVTPENLGPVTVQAHISGGSVRIEMFAATADGRDVLRQALPELKRDLAGAGVTASLDLSSNGQSGSPQGGQDRENFTRRYPSANQAPTNGRPLEMKDQTARPTPGLYGPDSRLDVMA